jgi:transposase
MLRDAVIAIPDDPAALREALLLVIDERDARITALETERDARIAALQAERDEAVRRLRLHLSKRYGPRAELLSPGQLSLFGDQVKAAEREAQAESETISVPGHTRRKPGPKPIPANLPREVIEHHLPAADRACPCCSKERLAVAWTTKERLKVVPAQIVVVEHRIPTYACPECAGQQVKAPGPALVLPKGIADASLVAMVAVSKFADHAPLYRQEGMLARSGIDLSRSTMCGWLQGPGELLVPLIELMRSLALAGRIIQSDDTTIPTLGLVKGSAKQARLWCYLGDATHRYALFEYTRTREGKHPQAWLAGFTGYLQTDEFAGYESICAPGGGGGGGGAIDVACWAHARRNFHDARTAAPDLCLRVMREIAKLYAVESRASEEKLDADQRQALREKLARPQMSVIMTMFESMRDEHLPKSPVRQAIEYVLKRRASFERYFEDGAIEIDNNACERCMRGPAIGRKNWLFAGSADGGVVAARWMTVIQSARLHEVEPLAYLTDVLGRLAEFRDLPEAQRNAERTARLTALLPDVWAKAHPDAKLALSR